MTLLKRYIAENKAGAILLTAGLFILSGGFTYLHYGHWTFVKAVEDSYANLGAEFISIAVTVLIIDYLNQRRQRVQLKAQLIREMSSTNNGFARRAIGELAAHGWLADGSLNGADLEEADLRKVNLEGANLEGANLEGANLKLAKLKLCKKIEELTQNHLCRLL